MKKTGRTVADSGCVGIYHNRAFCDGRDADLGHPGVYLDLEKTGKNACPYCGTVFVKAAEGMK